MTVVDRTRAGGARVFAAVVGAIVFVGGVPLVAQSVVPTVVDAGALARVRVVAVRAKLTIRAGDGDSLRSSVALAGGCSSRERAAFVVRSHVDRDELVLASTGVGETCVVQWEITVPRRLAADISLQSGEARVQGVGAGVSFDGGAASLDATLPGGPVRAKTGVGALIVQLENDNVGTIRLSSDVGTVALWMAGRKLSHESAPGSGDALSLTGEGEGSLRLSTGVGRVEARIGSAAPPANDRPRP